jgi:hypothetical protein
LKDRLVYLVDVQMALLKRKRDLDLFTVSVGQFIRIWLRSFSRFLHFCQVPFSSAA